MWVGGGGAVVERSLTLEVFADAGERAKQRQTIHSPPLGSSQVPTTKFFYQQSFHLSARHGFFL